MNYSLQVEMNSFKFKKEQGHCRFNVGLKPPKRFKRMGSNSGTVELSIFIYLFIYFAF